MNSTSNTVLLGIIALLSISTLILGTVLVKRQQPDLTTIEDSIARLSSDDSMYNFYIHYAEEVTCLAKNIYFEARGESRQGQVAVAHVVLNRVNSNLFPDTVCGVVTQGPINENILSEQNREVPLLHRCQFNWYCDGKSDTPRNSSAWNRSVRLAISVMNEELSDPTRGAKWFHNKSVNPRWDKLHRTVIIGDHVFYRLTD
jgi:N-acetylmuramoyl-L-alanine amidase